MLRLLHHHDHTKVIGHIDTQNGFVVEFNTPKTRDEILAIFGNCGFLILEQRIRPIPIDIAASFKEPDVSVASQKTEIVGFTRIEIMEWSEP